VDVQTKFTSVESLDGATMDFSSMRYSNGELEQSLRGFAGHTDKSDHAKVVYSQPEGLEYDLGQETLFPVMHTKTLIKAAMAGQKILTAHVFDGSDDNGASEINAIIGKKQTIHADINPSETSIAHIDKALMQGDAWHVEMASFRDNAPNNEAEYELQMTVLRNGIVKDMRVNYHDFTIVQTLVALENIKTDECGDSTDE